MNSKKRALEYHILCWNLFSGFIIEIAYFCGPSIASFTITNNIKTSNQLKFCTRHFTTNKFESINIVRVPTARLHTMHIPLSLTLLHITQPAQQIKSRVAFYVAAYHIISYHYHIISNKCLSL